MFYFLITIETRRTLLLYGQAILLASGPQQYKVRHVLMAIFIFINKVDRTRPLYIVALGNRVECLGKSVTQLCSKQIADLGQCH